MTVVNYSASEASGIDFLCVVRLYPVTGVTTLEGGAFEVVAEGEEVVYTGSVSWVEDGTVSVKIDGVLTIIPVSILRGTFPGWSVPEGTWSVEMSAAPLGFALKSVMRISYTLTHSALTPP
jgi:hypothetical protein